MKDAQVSSQDGFDPFQRFVGGIVLIILMMLVYVILKALLGISSTGVPYQGLGEALPEETLSAGELNAIEQGNNKPDYKYPNINKFVFLDLDGSPMSGDSINPNQGMEEVDFDDIDEDKRWFVQAASFKERQRADSLVKKLEDGGFEATVTQSGRWFAVRLMPQADRQDADRQLKQIRRQFGLRGQVKERQPAG